MGKKKTKVGGGGVPLPDRAGDQTGVNKKKKRPNVPQKPDQAPRKINLGSCRLFPGANQNGSVGGGGGKQRQTRGPWGTEQGSHFFHKGVTRKKKKKDKESPIFPTEEVVSGKNARQRNQDWSKKRGP